MLLIVTLQGIKNDGSIPLVFFVLRLIRDIMSMLFRVLCMIGLISVLLTLLLLDFMWRSDARVVHETLPRTAIVFTGDFDRIRKGLELLSSDEVGRLFVTGVNGDAGLNVDRFAGQFDLDAEQAGWIASGKIVLAPDAHTTMENAVEAECWVEAQPDLDSVVLVTSRSHMARASVALEHRIAPVSVVRMPSDPPDGSDRLQVDLIEFGKFAATWVVTLLPRNLWLSEEPSTCARL